VTLLPRILVIEDGHEYSERFQRFLGHEVHFARAACLAEARRELAAGGRGLLLDLDFRRTSSADLVDETGDNRVALADDERKRLAEMQGILILRALRSLGCALPALLFADIDDAGQIAFLERTFAPLRILSSGVSLPEIARQIREMVARRCAG
jgi:hypothetical protein